MGLKPLQGAEYVHLSVSLDWSRGYRWPGQAGHLHSFLDTGATCSVLSSLDLVPRKPAPFWELLVSQFLNISLKIPEIPTEDSTCTWEPVEDLRVLPLQEGKNRMFYNSSGFLILFFFFFNLPRLFLFHILLIS